MGDGGRIFPVEWGVLCLGTWNGKKEKDGFYLVGRILALKTYRFDYVKSTLLSAMNSGNGMKISEIGNDRYLFKFNHVLDKNYVWERTPWMFDKNLAILNAVEDDENPLTVTLDWSAFHVHVHGLSVR
ncbi:UNVERIFIED_CONTAM: hypothetical protein Scaly_1607100 [Sesamum calycinum]|uniref:DUF4283 domain-containing protein n=1 Tax=Sesamum calycinum TaxID=2727403 RepID=A0AAW2P8N7_9LAMI